MPSSPATQQLNPEHSLETRLHLRKDVFQVRGQGIPKGRDVVDHVPELHGNTPAVNEYTKHVTRDMMAHVSFAGSWSKESSAGSELSWDALAARMKRSRNLKRENR